MDVPKKKQKIQKITDTQIIQLAKWADSLQKHYYFPQDSEWALEKGKLFLVQTRPVTTIAQTTKVIKTEKSEFKIAQAPVLTGSGASPGIGTGIVRVLHSPKEINKIQKGDILVAPMTSPDYVPAMKRSSGIITDEGGQTSHAAIVSRELGIPCVVGTKDATKTLKDGQIVTVNGESGQIFLGSFIKTDGAKLKEAEKPKFSNTKTATKVYVNLA